MNTKQRNTFLASAIASGLFSLPATWMHFRNFESRVGAIGEQRSTVLRGVSHSVTGVDGDVSFLFTVPIWVVVCIAIGASLLHFMRESDRFAVSMWAIWATGSFAIAWMVVPLAVSLTPDHTILGIGTLLGIYCAAVPLICAILSRRDPMNSTP